MTILQLGEIIKSGDKKKIATKLKLLGYTLCNKDRKLCNVGLVELVNAITQETDDIVDNVHKRLYNGRICGTVKDYENYEFVIVNIYNIQLSVDPFDDEETAIQSDMFIWAKERK